MTRNATAVPDPSAGQRPAEDGASVLADGDANHGEAAQIRARLVGLEEERRAHEVRLATLEAERPADSDGGASETRITNRSPWEATIAPFRSLFADREDVFPRRWESARTGRAGYAPACANEWKPGVFGPPRHGLDGGTSDARFSATAVGRNRRHPAGIANGVEPAPRARSKFSEYVPVVARHDPLGERIDVRIIVLPVHPRSISPWPDLSER